ncbi:MAG: CRTAC1 family protein [Isosphaeraceae bacterium]
MSMRRSQVAVVLATFAVVLVLAAGVRTVYEQYSKKSVRLHVGAVPHVKPSSHSLSSPGDSTSTDGRRTIPFRPHGLIDSSGFWIVLPALPPWEPDVSLEQIREIWTDAGHKLIAKLARTLAEARSRGERGEVANLLVPKALLFNYEGEPNRCYEVLQEARSLVESDDRAAREMLYGIIYLQGVTALRRGENDNCIMCRGESSCILPIAPAAVHTKPEGSRLAIRHFTEYLEQFPDDLGVRWLLNLAHMTLGEYPAKVDPRFLVSLDRFRNSEFDIGRFRDVGHLVGIDRFNQAGGAIMEDFDNDGLLDIVMSSFDPAQAMTYFKNKGDGTFADRSKEAGVTDQLGGLVCYQTDYDNDGSMDVFIPRGAWSFHPIRATLLRNKGAGVFADVTKEANLLDPVNSNGAAWADYDNDGWLDLFVCCEQQPNRLYHNRGDGTFEEVSEKAGLWRPNPQLLCKGVAWIDFDNDDDPDLFINNLGGPAELRRNNGDGTFTDVTAQMGIAGPYRGFSCWAWDYDNDGWLDIFATSYDRTLEDVVKGLLGQPHGLYPNKLYHNSQGKGFEDVTSEAGLDMVFATMGSNYADFDNDGFLDMYLGTGEPSLATLVPNRMFKNVGGKRFAEITGSSRTGHLQKGHGVACGDWDRDGDVDLFVEMGGAVNGDRYHDVLFQNPGQGNHSLTVKLVGRKTNRAAIGARIKLVTGGREPLTVHRHVSSGSSFGANPLEQTIGLGKADRVAVLEVHWPTSGRTQVFRDIAADQGIEITEFANSYRRSSWKHIPQPE